MCPVCQASPQNENLIKTIERKADENAYLSKSDSVSQAFVALFWDPRSTDSLLTSWTWSQQGRAKLVQRVSFTLL